MTQKQASNSRKLNEQTITIVGVGLIGGSIAAALKQRGYTGSIIGIGRNQSRLEVAIAANLIDEGTISLVDAASRSSLIIFCTPVNLIAEGVLSAASHCQPNTLITDGGSVKVAICQKATGQPAQGVYFVGSHPLAGSEKQGFEHATADLYQDKVCIITPLSNTPQDQTNRLKQFWEFLGMRVEVMSPAEHDRIVARTSHLPHLLAAVLTQTVLNQQTLDFLASGFQDSTRIAAGDANLWTSILLDNADAVLSGLDEYCDILEEFRRTLHNRDAQALKNLLQNAKTTRDKLG